MATTTMADRPILLTAYDAERCARRVHNDWDATIPQAPWEPPATHTAGPPGCRIAFENRVIQQLIEGWGERCLDLSPLGGSQQRIAAKVEAMDPVWR